MSWLTDWFIIAKTKLWKLRIWNLVSSFNLLCKETYEKRVFRNSTPKEVKRREEKEMENDFFLLFWHTFLVVQIIKFVHCIFQNWTLKRIKGAKREEEVKIRNGFLSLNYRSGPELGQRLGLESGPEPGLGPGLEPGLGLIHGKHRAGTARLNVWRY